MIGVLHTCNANEYIFRGPIFLYDKEMRERVYQYNLKHKDNEKVDVPDDRLYKPPQRLTIPKVNKMSADVKGKEYSEEDEYKEMYDTIDTYY